MPPVSASKAKRAAEKAAKAAAKASTTSGSLAGSTISEVTSVATSRTGSTEDLSSDLKSMAKITERSAAGVLVSDPKSRDIKLDSYTLSFHGRLLFENAEVSLNYGNRYGLLGENGSGKSTFLESLAARDIEIP